MSDFKEMTDQIQSLANNPEAAMSNINNHIQGISDHLPDLSRGISSTLSNGIAYLNSKIPRPPSMLPLDTWEPSEKQKQEFEHRVDAVDNPVDVMRKIKDGSLNLLHLEALQSVHPQLLDEMRNQLKNRISPDVAKKLPNHIKRGISMFLGQPLELSDTQPVKAANQMTFAVQQAQKQAKVTQSGMDKIKIGDRNKTKPYEEETGKV